MSELQLGLLGIGLVVVIGVLAYNKWQDIRYRREAERNFGSSHDDVLLQPGKAAGSRTVSGAPADRTASPESEERPPVRIEPVFRPESEPFQRRTMEGGSAPHQLTEAFDFIVVAEGADEIKTLDIIQAATQALGNTPKVVRWEGFSEQAGAWEPIRADGRYADIRAGMQLVDRSGAASAEDLAAFEASVQQVALALGAIPLDSNRAAAANRALELDRFCGEVDIQIALNIVPKPGAQFSGARIRNLAEAAGLKHDPDGRFRQREGGDELFSLSVRGGAPFPESGDSPMNGLTLELDVPRAPGGMHTFEKFRNCALKLAAALDAHVTDDNGAPLSQAAFDSLATRLSAVHGVMEDHGLRAGGPAALRLFA